MAHKHYYLTRQSMEAATMLNANLLYSGTVKDDPHWFNVPHQHEFCEILYIVHGNGTVVLDGVSSEVTGGDLIIINPKVLHEEKSNPDSPLNFVFIAANNFQIGNMEPNFLLAPNARPIINSQKYKYKIESLFTDIISETSGMITFYAEMSIYLVNALILLILRMLLVDNQPNDISRECKKVKEYIDQNYILPITLDTLSESVYISKHHFAHLFKQQTGVSPIKYLITCRIEEATRLLVETNYSIAKVASMVGYEDPVYFSQIFKHTKGVSPMAYRKSH